MAMKLRRKLTKGLLLLAGLWLLQLLFFRFVPVFITPHLLAQRISGVEVQHKWVPLEEISAQMPRAVIAAEDNRFCQHWGVDWSAMKIVWKEYREGHRIRGGSTISMQTTKNAYLWLGRSKLRKLIELLLVTSVDRVWGKQRVMEVYLNLAEFGPGIYGVQAAAEHHFHTKPSRLTATQAARLAAVLPAPRDWSASRPSRFVRRRGRLVEHRMAALGDGAVCMGDGG
jgi:monofunctional biosynthetic peptidoglycan transglycosylase